MKKYGFALFTALCLCLALMSTAAFATTEINYLDEQGTTQKLTDNYYVVNADTTFAGGGVYVVDTDVTIPEGVTLSGDTTLILCDGKTLTASKGMHLGSHHLTVYGQTGGTGLLSVQGVTVSDASYGIYGGISSRLTVNGGSVVGVGNGQEFKSYGITCGKLTVNGGTVSGSGYDGNSYGISVTELTVTKGKVTGKRGMNPSTDADISCTKLTVSGGELEGIVFADGGALSGGQFTCLKSTNLANLLAAGHAYATKDESDNYTYYKLSELSDSLTNVEVKPCPHGEFSAPDDNDIDEDKWGNETYNHNVYCLYCGVKCPHTEVGENGVCQCGIQMEARVDKPDGTTMYYEKLAKAFSNATGSYSYSGSAVVVLKNVTIGDYYRSRLATEYADITLDLNGKTVTGSSSEGVLYINAYPTSTEVLLVKNGTLKNNQSSAPGIKHTRKSGSNNNINLILENVTVETNNGNAIVKDDKGNLTVEKDCVFNGVVKISDNPDTVTLKGGTYVKGIDSTSYKELLGEGCAFADKDGHLIEVKKMDSSYTNIKVVEHDCKASGGYGNEDGVCKWCGHVCCENGSDCDTIDPATGVCATCGKQFGAGIGNTYYDDFKQAYTAAQDDDTIKLFSEQDWSKVGEGDQGVIQKNLTLDLNGQNMTGEATVKERKDKFCAFAIKDSTGNNGTVKKVSLWTGNSIVVDSGKVTELGGSGEVYVNGGEVGTLNVRGLVTVTDGKIRNFEVGFIENITLTGGTFEKITVNDENTCYELLGTGYAYADTSGKLCQPAVTKGAGEYDPSFISNVQVVKCTHGEKTEEGICPYCKEMIYLDSEGKKQVLEESYTVIDGSGDWNNYGANGDNWYAVTGDLTLSGMKFYDDNAHLILCDGATLTVNGSIVGEHNLHIYAQSTGAHQGKLVVKDVSAASDRSCGIKVIDDLTINGGTITANGGASTVDGGDSYGVYVGGKLTMTRGTLTANGGQTSDENGSSYGIVSWNLQLSDCVVTANGGESRWSFGINSNADAENKIVNSTVTATGGTAEWSRGLIFYAQGDSNAALTVINSMLTATGGTATAGHSYGIESRGGALTIQSGTVNATGGRVYGVDQDTSVGIYVRENTLTVAGGTVTAKGGTSGAYSEGILMQENGSLLVSGGIVNAIGGTSTNEENFYSSGIALSSGVNGVLSGGTVNATGGSGHSSCGINIGADNLTVSGATVTAKGGAGTNSSIGVSVNGNVIVTAGKLTAEGGVAEDSLGIDVLTLAVSGGEVVGNGGKTIGTGNNNSFGIRVNSKTTISGGKVTATYNEETVDGGEAEVGVYDLALLDLTVSGGEIKLTEDSQVVGYIKVGGDVTLRSLIPEGYGYWRGNNGEADGNFVATKDVTELAGEVTDEEGNLVLDDEGYPLAYYYLIKTCTHSYEDGECVYCGAPKPPSSSNTITTVETKPDGTTTTTTTNKKTGETTEVTKHPDGSTTTTVTDKDGNVTKTETNANGSGSTTVTDKDGNVTEITVSVSDKDAQSGETVTLPVDEVTPSDKSENAPTIKIEAPKGETTVEIPVKNPTAGTVIVVVDENGKETVVSDTKRTENGLSFVVSGNVTIKIVDKTVKFDDVPEGEFYTEAVAWASSRGITTGMTETLFGVNENCNRAQLVTFLWRAAGRPTAETQTSFVDVPAGEFYTEAVQWAASVGIVEGYGDGTFGVNDTVTREQVATILYRYEQSLGGGFTGAWAFRLNFEDVAEISEWAFEGISWCVMNEVMQGYEGYLTPQAPCNRAQIVTMLYRYMTK